MNKIVVINNMFDKNQSIVIYKDNQLIETVDADIDDMVDIVKGLCSKYSITTVDLVGNQSYLEKYKQQFNTEFSNITVNIVSR